MAPKKKSRPIQDDHVHELADIFRLLGDPNRLKIVIACIHEKISVGDIAEKTQISQPLVSHHLRLLKAARLLRHEKQGKQVFYALSDDHIRCVLEDMLTHINEPKDD